ncbi:MAG: cell division protein FtsZ [Bacteroidales bacterium]|nr:cell division protein FtsZ [Bacteroidales bacterium]
MTDLLNFELPQNQPSIIKVIGVGGGGSNAVDYMYQRGIEGVDFIICNTDAQALNRKTVPNKIQLGSKGLGAGNAPDKGRQATEESIDKIVETLGEDTQMLFITAGMGGGTGTGGAPIIAQKAKEMGILTVGIVTTPFYLEGPKRMKHAHQGIEELKKYVDTYLIINNDKLREYHGDLSLAKAFSQADDVLATAAKSIAEIITIPGYVNVDFEDVKTVIENSGKAIMGNGTAEGENRTLEAIESALASPLLEDDSIKGASDILLYMASGPDREISFDEFELITDFIQKEAENNNNTNIIWGNGTDDSMGNHISITVIATGFNNRKPTNKKLVGTIGEEEGKPQVNKEGIAEESVRLKKQKSDENDPGQQKLDIEFNSTSRPSSPPKPKDKRITYKPVKENPEEEEEPSDKLADNRQKELSKHVNRQKKVYTDPNEIERLAKEPAYKRRNFELNENKPSKESNISRYVLGKDEYDDPELKDNSYLNKKVD